MAGSGEKWRWADPQGTQRIVHADELRAALASGALPPYTLVWRRGMAEWQPAYAVGELATAAIAARQGVIPNVPPPPLHIVAVQAQFERRSDEKKGGSDNPPPPPVHEYRTIAASVPEHLVGAPSSGPFAAISAAARPMGAPPSARTHAHVATSPYDNDENGELETLVARPVVLPGATPRAALPAPSAPASLSRAPSSRGGPRSPLSAPPRRAYPGSGGQPSAPHAPASHAPPPPRRTIPGPGPAPGAAIAPLAPPIAVPAPHSFARGQSTQSPPFDGAAEVANGAEGAWAPVPAAPGMPEASSLGFAPRRPSSEDSNDLPAFPLDDLLLPDEAEVPVPGEAKREEGGHASASVAASEPGLPRGTAPGAQLGDAPGTTSQPWGVGAPGAQSSPKTSLLPQIARAAAYVRAHPRDPKVIAGAAGLLLLLVLIVVALSSSSSHAVAGSTVDEPPHAATEQGGLLPEKAESPVPTPAAAAVASPAPTAPAESPAPTAAIACRRVNEASRLADKAFKDVPLELSMSASAERAWLGYAADAASARGLSIDVSSGRVKPEFAAKASKIRAVVPALVHGKATYAVDGENKRDVVQAARTVPGEAPHIIGWADHALVYARRATDAPRVLWALEGDSAPEVIRAMPTGEQETIAFRRNGNVWMGLLGRDRAPQGALVPVAGAGAPPGSPVGSPTMAANDESVAIAFADRASSNEPWSLRISSAPLGSLPSQTNAFRVPAGGPGGAALAPALAGLAGGRWLLVWTEGSGGQHDLRAQTLAADLSPVGAAFTVSNTDHNAGQGAVALSAGQGFVAYLRLTAEGYELWGAGLDCR